MLKHLQAKPKDEKIRKNFPLVTPEQAQTLHSNNIIKNKRDFICATESCTAPITCCLMDKPDSTPYFIEQSRKENYHIDSCDFSNRKTKSISSTLTTDTEFSVEFTGEYTGNSPRDIFNQGLGDSFLTSSIPQTESINVNNNDSNNLSDNNHRNNSKDSSPNEKKSYNKRISDIQTAVHLFETDPSIIISKWFLGDNLPIRKYFKPITQNHLPYKFYDSVHIFYGVGFIVNTVNSDYLFNFGKKVVIENQEYRPQFFVDKEFINQCFPFLKERVETNPKMPFRIYIRSRFYFYENKNDKSIKKLRFRHDKEDLLNLIYFSDI